MLRSEVERLSHQNIENLKQQQSNQQYESQKYETQIRKVNSKKLSLENEVAKLKAKLVMNPFPPHPQENQKRSKSELGQKEEEPQAKNTRREGRAGPLAQKDEAGTVLSK